MRVAPLLLALALSLGDLSGLWQSILRRTNSLAANRRGISAYGKKQYDDAIRAFGEANGIRPTPEAAYDLGTAQIAAGRREDGSASLARALADPALRADALYNRGTSALGAKAFDSAIRDYTDVLRLRPNDAAAKRNLEIALTRKEQQQQQQQQGNGPGAPPKPDQKKEPGSGGQREEQKSEQRPGVDQLLRSVQQQEREELSRMNQAKAAPRRVGW
jgi:tetratricopeptide (TPR) repeat protein